MTCEKVRVELPAYLAGELDEAASRLVADHLAHCAACIEEMKAVERLQERIARELRAWVDAGTAPPGLEAELRRAVRMASAQPEAGAEEALDFRHGWAPGAHRPGDVTSLARAGAVAGRAGGVAAGRAEWWRTLATGAAAVAVALLLVSSLPESPALQGLPVVGGLVQLLQGAGDEVPLERAVTRDGVTLRVHSVRYSRHETQVRCSLTGVQSLDQLETGDLAGTLLAGTEPLPLRKVQVDVSSGRVLVTFGAAPPRVPLIYRLGPLPEVPGGPWEVELGFRP
nr:MAG: hypothetical protein DIU70_03540 [Bacillota bacterium]